MFNNLPNRQGCEICIGAIANYFAKACDLARVIGDVETLVDIARSVGLDDKAAREVIENAREAIRRAGGGGGASPGDAPPARRDRKSTRLNSSHRT